MRYLADQPARLDPDLAGVPVRHGPAQADAPFVYRIAGLDDVVLLNGFKIKETDYGPGVSIKNVEQLHRAIGLHIITTKKSLSAKEFLFLRREMKLTQDQSASCLGVDG